MRRRIVWLATVIGIVAVAAGGWAWRERTAPRPDRVAGYPDLRHDLLSDLRDRLIPTSEGGWAAATPGEPVVDVWLRAAAASSDAASFDRALAEAARAFDDDDDGRPLGLVLAGVLPGPATDRAAADELAHRVLDRAQARIDREPSWLGPLLQLSAGESTASSAATRELVRRAGAGRCDRLPAPGDPLPDPATSLTVAVRVLAGSGIHCERALPVLDAALRSPAWGVWIAVAELADLAQVAPSLPASTRRLLEQHLDGLLEVRSDAPIDLGALTSVLAARRATGSSGAVPEPLARHIAGQVAHRGGLPGRSTSPPTGFDVAIVRQLVGEEMVPAGALRSTEESAAWPEVTEATDPVVDRLLVGSGEIRCADAPSSPPQRTRPTFEGVTADQTWAIVRSACDGTLELAPIVRAIQRDAPEDQRALRTAVAELAACRLDPSLLDAVAGRRLRPTGPFATDALQVWARSVAADPAAACAAVRR